MQLAGLDWAIIVGFFVFWLALGAFVSRKAGQSTEQFFLAGRSMPWWLLGFSLVATTFAADTPLFVAGLVRRRGVAGNWNWWAFLLNGMLTVFVFAKLWHRSGLHTDLEFYELRYSGKPAAFLRCFRAIYLGTFFNIMIMAVVTLAAIKISGVMLGLHPWTTITAACVITAIFSAAGGLTSVIWVDAFMFLVAMVGSIGAAVVALRDSHVGGLSGLFSNAAVQKRMEFLPGFHWNGKVPVFDWSAGEARTALLRRSSFPSSSNGGASGIPGPSRAAEATSCSGCSPPRVTDTRRVPPCFSTSVIMRCAVALDHRRSVLDSSFIRRSNRFGRRVPTSTRK